MATETPIYDRTAVADLMALVDTYADTACSNGIRSAWAQMARAAVEAALIKERTRPAPAASPVPEFARVAQQKLEQLQERGYIITGYCFERSTGEPQPQRGFVDFAGFVGWWRPEMMPDLSTLTERGAAAWNGVAAQDLREGKPINPKD